MAISVFDLFKIGIGPSSSHTVGPMRAARLFAAQLHENGLLAQIKRIRVVLYGSLGATGKGHASDHAIMLGLEGYAPDTVDIDSIPERLADIRACKKLIVTGKHPIYFDEAEDLIFNYRENLPGHVNGMRFQALDARLAVVDSKIYYSVGGGFVVSEQMLETGLAPQQDTVLPLPLAHEDNVSELQRLAQSSSLELLAAQKGAVVAAGAARITRSFRLLGATTVGYDREREVDRPSTERSCSLRLSRHANPQCLRPSKEAGRGQEDCGRRSDDEQRPRSQERLGLVQHPAPRGSGRLDSDREVRQDSLCQDHRADEVCPERDGRPHDVR